MSDYFYTILYRPDLLSLALFILICLLWILVSIGHLLLAVFKKLIEIIYKRQKVKCNG